MSRDKNCRETSFVSQLSRNYPHRRVNFERGKNALVGQRQFWRHFRRQFGRGNCDSKIVARQWGVSFCRETSPEGPRIEKIQSREAILKKSSFQYGMKISIENEIFIPGSSLAAEKQGLGLKFSIENEIFKPRMKISRENDNFVRGGMVFFMCSLRGPNWGLFLSWNSCVHSEISSTVSKVLSDRKVLFKHKNGR